MQKNKIIKEDATTVYVGHPESSYGIFCFNSFGDLFLNSDWGFYGYSWRAFGDDFESFLKQLNAEYLVGKFAINYHSDGRPRKMWKHKETHLLNLANIFISELKNPTE